MSLNSTKNTFSKINSANCASDYVNKKKLDIFCKYSICYPNKNINSQSNLLFLNKLNKYKFNRNSPCYFNKYQLYSNLYSQLDLNDLSSNTPVICDLSGNIFPVIMDTSVVTYLKYNIDPSGVLFGNDICGTNNFLHLRTFNL